MILEYWQFSWKLVNTYNTYADKSTFDKIRSIEVRGGFYQVVEWIIRDFDVDLASGGHFQKFRWCVGETATHSRGILTSASKSSIRRFVITEKAPTRAFS